MIWGEPLPPRNPFERDEPRMSPHELREHHRRLDEKWCEHGRDRTLCPMCSDLS